MKLKDQNYYFSQIANVFEKIDRIDNELIEAIDNLDEDQLNSSVKFHIKGIEEFRIRLIELLLNYQSDFIEIEEAYK